MNTLEKIGIVALCVVVGGLIAKYGFKASRHVSVVVVILVFIVTSLLLVVAVKDKKSEHFTVTQEGCTQNITINQNCSGGGKHPLHPIEPAVSKADIRNWVKHVDPNLTEECQDCIVDSAFNLWSAGNLNKVLHMPLDKQKTILNALLVFDCNKQCVIPAHGLTEQQVEKWLKTVLHNPVNQDCCNCITNAILKLWSPKDLDKVQQKSMDAQRKIVEAIWALDCPHCESQRLSSKEVENWLSSVIAGAKPDCYKCAVDNIMKLWDEEDFRKAKHMKADSQRQLVQALIDLHCLHECVEIPSGLNKQVVLQWLTTEDTGESMKCYDCAADHIVKMWTPASFAKVKKLPPLERSKIINGVIVLNCESSCLDSQHGPSEAAVLEWIKKTLPKCGAACQKCIAQRGAAMWNKAEFHKLKALSTLDQAKTAKLLGEFNCPHVCDIEPVNESNYSPY